MVIILGDLIIYRDKMIYFKIGLVELEVKGRHIVMSFNILLLRKDKMVLGMPFLWEYNLRIDWVMGDIKIQDI